MSRWWRLWSGHVFVVLFAILMAACALFALVYVRTASLQVLIPLAVFFFGAVAVGVLATWRYNTRGERYQIRNESRLAGKGYAALGQHEGDE